MTNMRSSKWMRTLGLLSSLLLAGGMFAVGQMGTEASLGGRVTDPNGAVIVNATVTVTADATQVVQTTKTDGAGDWNIRYLIPGFYHFEVAAPGFKTVVHPSIQLQVGDQKFIDTQMQLGTATQTVTVQATTPLIDTTSAVSGTVITGAELSELPNQSNAPTMLIGLTPGAIVSGGVGGGVFLWSNQGLSGTILNQSGVNAWDINYSIDGGTVTNNAGEIAFEPPTDAVSEIRVETNAYDASISRQGAGTVSLSLKSGTNKLHGDVYEDNQNNSLIAHYYNNIPKLPTIHVNYYGGGVGGPIWIPMLYNGRARKTYWYYTFAGIRNLQPANTGLMSVPTALEKQGDFSQSYTTQTVNGVRTVYPIQIYDPSTWNYDGQGDREQFTNNTIPTQRLDGPALAYLKLIPDPEDAGDGANSDSNNYVKNEEQNDKFAGSTLRFDQTWNENNKSYIDLRYNNWSEISYDPFGPNPPYVYANGLSQTRSNRGFTVDHTIILNPRLVADLRYTITGWRGASYSSSLGVSQTTLGFPSSFASLSQYPSIPQVNGIVGGDENGGLGTAEDTYTHDTNQDIDVAFTQTVGAHNLKFGMEWLLQQEGYGALGASGGQFSFGTNWTTENPNKTAGTGVGDATASMLLGLPNSGYIPTNATEFWSQPNYGFYIQDDWRRTSKLTLNFGLRWDYERPLTERYNRYYSRYDPTVAITPVTAVAQPAYSADILGGNASSNAGIQLLQQYRPDVSSFVVTGGVLYAGVNGTSREIDNPKYKYFQPRIGFAYKLRQNTVLRGGLGRFLQGDFYSSMANQSGYSESTPFVGTTDNYEHIATTWDNPFPNGLIAPTGNSLGILTNVGSTTSYVDPNVGRDYVDTASLDVQQQISDYVIDVGGAFDETHGLWIPYPVNIPSVAAWYAANTPTFAANGLPDAELPGNTQVPNPFKGAPYITNGLQDDSTIAASQLLDPDPVVGTSGVNSGQGIEDNHGNGISYYYALNTKVNRRFHNGFSVIQAFVWSKAITEDNLYGPLIAERTQKVLSGTDQKLHYTLTPIYQLPFGSGMRFDNHAGKLMNELIGGWEVTGQYNFLSGIPLTLPTNGENSGSGFFEGGNPSLGHKKTGQEWFDTSKFAPFPTESTTVAALATYPSWTNVLNLPGANYHPTSSSGPQNGVYQDFATWGTYNQTRFGNIRTPYTNNVNLGMRKSFALGEGAQFQLRMDAFNAFNHPQFGNIDTTVGDQYFGALSGTDAAGRSQVNAPREIELGGRITF